MDLMKKPLVLGKSYGYQASVKVNERVFEQAEVEESLGLDEDGLDVVLVDGKNNLSGLQSVFPTSHQQVAPCVGHFGLL